MFQRRSLSNEEIGRLAPSVMAVAPYEAMSEKYLMIPTIQLIDGLRDEGYVPTSVMVCRSRSEGKKAHAQHLIRFCQERYLYSDAPDVPEVVMRNNSCGDGAYKFWQGVFRMVCTNGLITGDINSAISVIHRGNILENVLQATYKIAEEAEATMETIAQMKQIELTRREQLLLAEFAVKARFGSGSDEPSEEQVIEGEYREMSSPSTSTALVTTTYAPEQLLRVHRRADTGTDLYTTMNVIQENAIKGSAHGWDTKGHRHTARAVKGIDQTVKVNTLPWQFPRELPKFNLES